MGKTCPKQDKFKVKLGSDCEMSHMTTEGNKIDRKASKERFFFKYPERQVKKRSKSTMAAADSRNQNKRFYSSENHSFREL